MEETLDQFRMLDLLPQPAFCVRDGQIIHVNEHGKRRMICPQTSVRELIQFGADEYAAFMGGCLYLTLNIADTPCGASVTRMQDFDVFVLEDGEDHADLQAMALAAQELRLPLSSMMTVADNLFPVIGTSDDPTVQDQVARINRSLFRMLRIIGNMSDAYRYSQDLGSCQEVRDICGTFAEVFSASAATIAQADVTLRYSLPTESIYCLADEEKLERAVNNILSNAMKFTPKGGTIDAKLTHKGNLLYLTVQDSGSGIPSQVQGNVYSRYQRQPGIEDSRYGIGLGMVLIRSAAAAHGGTVLIEQPQGQGMKITMTMQIRTGEGNMVRSPLIRIDYAGERDHRLIELSDNLPVSLYRKENIN